jgi:LysM repeat protein
VQSVVQPEPNKEIENAANKAPADDTKSSEPAVQSISPPDATPKAAQQKAEGTADAGAKTDAAKAVETAATEKKADIDSAASDTAEILKKDAVQVAAVAAPAEVMKDVPAPIEAKQQADSIKAVEEGKNYVAGSEAVKEPAPEKASAPAVEPDQKKETEKVAAIKPDAEKALKPPEPQTIKKTQQTKKSSAKSAAKAPQKKVKTAASKYHVIAQGDTLMSLARKYNTDADKLRKLNGLYDESILRVGSKIRIN